MGYEKLGTLALKCKEYAVACGKRSILETKPVKNLNVKELGVCLPDGTISFQTEQVAKNYSRNICMKQGLVPAAEQREIAVLRQKNRILGVAGGDNSKVRMNDLLVPNLGKDNLVVEHYHPDCFGKGKTFPLSIGNYGMGDSSVFSLCNLQSIVAYNSLGQYNKLERLPNFSCEALEQLGKLERNEVMQRALSEDDRVVKSLASDIVNSNFTVSEKTCRKLSKLRSKIDKKMSDFKVSQEYRQFLHKLWQENAEKCGVKYSTNMYFSV